MMYTADQLIAKICLKTTWVRPGLEIHMACPVAQIYTTQMLVSKFCLKSIWVRPGLKKLMYPVKTTVGELEQFPLKSGCVRCKSELAAFWKVTAVRPETAKSLRAILIRGDVRRVVLGSWDVLRIKGFHLGQDKWVVTVTTRHEQANKLYRELKSIDGLEALYAALCCNDLSQNPFYTSFW
jgi:hypothetical protein